MRVRNVLLIFGFCFWVGESCAQKQGNIWYFGNHAGLDFNSGVPVAISNGQTYSPDASPPEGSAVISDSSGSLLFYTNGQTVWDRTQQIMPNGDSLLGHWSSTQSAIIIPLPGSSRYFYVFTTDAFYADNLRYGFRYSVVDMCLNNELGDVITGQKNILLLDTVTEKLTAVRHANGIDYWIIIHKFYSDAFYSYLLTSSGIVDTVLSHIGSTHGGGTGTSIGQMKASPDGNKLTTVNGNAGALSIAEYFDFNNASGVASNWVNLKTTFGAQYQFYGVSFSPDNSKLYIACWLNGNGLYQFDLTRGGGLPDSVRASKTLIHGTYNYYGMQLGPDGKIYIAKGGYGNLGVINYPNLSGLNCNYVDNAIALTGGSGLEPPNFIDSYDYSNTINFCCNISIPEISQVGDTLNVANSYSTYQWYHDSIPISGATNYFYVASSSGNYFISVTDSNGCEVKAGILNVIASTQSAITNPQTEIFPNPAHHQLTIRTQQPTANTFLLIHDAMGKLIYSNSLSFGEGRGEAYINVSAWRSGLYFYEVINDDGRSTGKFVVE
jgi:hypothetical protein